MKKMRTNIRAGFSLDKLVVGGLVVLIAALLVILVRRFTVWGGGSRAASDGSISYTASRVERITQLINNQATTAAIMKEIESHHWSAVRLNRAFGLYLVESAAYYDRPGLVKALLSKHAPVNGNGNFLPFSMDDPGPNNPLDATIHSTSPDPKIIKMLLAAGADPFARFSTGDSKFSSAYEDSRHCRNPEVTKIFMALKRRKVPIGGGGAASTRSAAGSGR